MLRAPLCYHPAELDNPVAHITYGQTDKIFNSKIIFNSCQSKRPLIFYDIALCWTFFSLVVSGGQTTFNTWYTVYNVLYSLCSMKFPLVIHIGNA